MKRAVESNQIHVNLRDLKAQYVASAAKGLSIKTKQKTKVGWDHGSCCLKSDIFTEEVMF